MSRWAYGIDAGRVADGSGAQRGEAGRDVHEEVHELVVVLGVLQLVHEPRERALRVHRVYIHEVVGCVAVVVVEADDAEAGPHEHRVAAEALDVAPHLRVVHRQPPAPPLARRQVLIEPVDREPTLRRVRRREDVRRQALMVPCSMFSVTVQTQSL